MTFNHRFLPAIMRAHEIIQNGALGDIFHFRAEYLHTGYEDPDRPIRATPRPSSRTAP